METRIYRVPASSYKVLKKVLEADPYSPGSFARVGYVLRQAKGLGIEGEEYYLKISAEKEILENLEEKLRDVQGLERLEGEEYEKVKKRFEEQEESAAIGLGSIFG